jgi:hypothetical protein
MTTRINDVEVLKIWLHNQPERYVVLREKTADGTLIEINLLADLELANRLDAQFPREKQGVKIDVYGKGRADYLGFSHLPDGLAEACLHNRTLEKKSNETISSSGWYRAQPLQELQALLYHLCYHKPDKSGFIQDFIAPFNEPGPASLYAARAQQLQEMVSAPSFSALPDVHTWLSEQQLVIDVERLQAYVRYQCYRGTKSYFHAWLMNQLRGELNLFVIRGVAIKFKQTGALLQRLSREYQILETKAVPWRHRLMKMRHMRGGKWKRGGKPHIAVVVFDPHPVTASEAERQVHPFVFNARQFIKRQWRDWFAAETGARPQDNPIHSTDNEAEAIGHLPLFFDAQEQGKLLSELALLRSTDISESKAVCDVS